MAELSRLSLVGDAISEHYASGVFDRSRAVKMWYCLRYGLTPYWTYERRPHYRRLFGWSGYHHWRVNLTLLGMLWRRAL